LFRYILPLYKNEEYRRVKQDFCYLSVALSGSKMAAKYALKQQTENSQYQQRTLVFLLKASQRYRFFPSEWENTDFRHEKRVFFPYSRTFFIASNHSVSINFAIKRTEKWNKK